MAHKRFQKVIMALVQFTCPHCQAPFLAEGSLAGREAICPTCRQMLVLPGAPDGASLNPLPPPISAPPISAPPVSAPPVVPPPATGSLRPVPRRVHDVLPPTAGNPGGINRPIPLSSLPPEPEDALRVRDTPPATAIDETPPLTPHERNKARFIRNLVMITLCATLLLLLFLVLRKAPIIKVLSYAPNLAPPAYSLLP